MILNSPSGKGSRYDIIYFPLGAAAFGGAEHSLLDLSEGVARRGKKVLIAAERALEKTSFPAEAAKRGLSVQWVDWAPERSIWSNTKAAIHFLRVYRAGIFHFNIAWRRNMWLLPLLARLLTSSRIIGSMRAMPDPHQLIPRRWHLGFIPGIRLWHISEVLVGRIWARTLHLTVCVNAGDFPPRLAAHYGFNPARMRVIYNGIPFRTHPLEPVQRAKIRADLRIPDNEVLICFLGRLAPEKGAHYLLQALTQLPETFSMILMGDGPQRPALETLAQETGIQRRVQFLGARDYPDDIIAASDLVLVPSTWYEAFGRVVVEAMNQGVPVVATKIGGMAELFTDGIEGAYVESPQPEVLAKKIQTLARDHEKLHAMGAAGRELVRMKYSVSRVIEQYAEAYNELLSKAQLERRPRIKNGLVA